jgi:hypothetical protein
MQGTLIYYDDYDFLKSMKTKEYNLTVSLEQILSLVDQCTPDEKDILVRELMKDSLPLMLASANPSLSKDWLSMEEDEAWKDL